MNQWLTAISTIGVSGVLLFVIIRWGFPWLAKRDERRDRHIETLQKALEESLRAQVRMSERFTDEIAKAMNSNTASQVELTREVGSVVKIVERMERMSKQPKPRSK